MHYNCKDNDTELRVVKTNGLIDEILVRDGGSESWTVIGYNDLLAAIKQTQLFESRLNHVMIESIKKESTPLEAEIYSILLQSMINCDYNSGRLTLKKIQSDVKVFHDTVEIMKACKSLVDRGFVDTYKPRLNKKLYFVTTEGILKGSKF